MNNEQTMPHLCDLCGSKDTVTRYDEERFVYGAGEDEVVLSALIPVVQCQSCGEAFSAEGAEEIRHNTICRHLGRMTPAEIRALRERYGLSQENFAKFTNLGVASIKRWEAGNLIQSASNDSYMRLLLLPSNMRLVQARPASHGQQPQFQTKFSSKTFDEAMTFQLRIVTAKLVA